MACVSSSLSARSCTRSPHSSFGSVITQVCWSYDGCLEGWWGGRWTHLGDGSFYSHGVDSGHWGVPSLWASWQDEQEKQKHFVIQQQIQLQFSKHFLMSVCASNQHLMQTNNWEGFISWQETPRVSIICLPSPSPSLPRDVVDLTSREPFLRSLCLLDWMSGEKKTPYIDTNTSLVTRLTLAPYARSLPRGVEMPESVQPEFISLFLITLTLLIDSVVSHKLWCFEVLIQWHFNNREQKMQDPAKWNVIKRSSWKYSSTLKNCPINLTSQIHMYKIVDIIIHFIFHICPKHLNKPGVILYFTYCQKIP